MIPPALLPNSDDLSITFLLGENGSGKSRMLCQLANDYLRNGLSNTGCPVIAISNTVFDRFPGKKASNYFRLSPSRGKGYALTAFKQALSIVPTDEFRHAKQIGRVLIYAGFEPVVGVKVALAARTTAMEVADRIRYVDDLNVDDVSLISSWFGYESGFHEREIRWLDFYDSYIDPKRNGFLAILRNEAALKKAKLIKRISLHLRKDRFTEFELSEASSGELSLISTYTFLATRIEEGAVLLIDEPENSLHPRWQSDYCRQLLDQFYLYRPRIVIASHSPIVVSGAEADKIPFRVLTPPWTDGVAHAPRSIDGILMEAFGMLVPASHYLSEKVTSLLNDLMFHKVTLDDVKSELNRLRSLSYDAKQKDFLGRAVELAEKVDIESKGKATQRSEGAARED